LTARHGAQSYQNTFGELRKNAERRRRRLSLGAARKAPLLRHEAGAA
jgi:hypothetical protein